MSISVEPAPAESFPAAASASSSLRRFLVIGVLPSFFREFAGVGVVRNMVIGSCLRRGFADMERRAAAVEMIRPRDMKLAESPTPQFGQPQPRFVFPVAQPLLEFSRSLPPDRVSPESYSLCIPLLEASSQSFASHIRGEFRQSEPENKIVHSSHNHPQD